jgi:hypothetical protein
MTTDTKRTRGRPANLEKTLEWKIMIPESLAAPVELLCLDPVRNKPAFGARSAYISRLIREDLERRRMIEPDEKA